MPLILPFFVHSPSFVHLYDPQHDTRGNGGKMSICTGAFIGGSAGTDFITGHGRKKVLVVPVD